jgi:hypothetical protein
VLKIELIDPEESNKIIGFGSYLVVVKLLIKNVSVFILYILLLLLEIICIVEINFLYAILY